MSESVFATISTNLLNGLAFDSLGNLYCANGSNNTIAKITSDGSVSTFATGLFGPRDIVFDNSDNLYCTSFSGNNTNSIIKITSDGSKSVFATGFSASYGLAFDNLGNLYASSKSSPISIKKITKDGSVSTIISGLSEALDITFDNLGNLYYLGVSGVSGALLKVISDISSTTIANGLSGSIGLCFDGIGNFYCGGNFGLISKISIDGSRSVFKDLSSLSVGSGPRFLTFDNSGNLYCSTSNGKIIKIPSVIPPPVSNICFPAGTPVQTDQGLIPIDKINTNSHTIRNNKIVTITRTITQDKNLVCIEKDALGKNIPNERTLISRNHELFYNGKMIKAIELLDKINNTETVYKVKYSGEVLYNVLLDKHDKMIVNNLICETLNPVNGIARMYLDMEKNNFTNKEKQEFINKYNQYVAQNKTFTPKK
jgi:hypothetical protein